MSVVAPRMKYARPARRRVQVSRSALLPTYPELWAVVLLFAFYLVAESLVGEDSYSTVNLVGASCLTVILGYGGWLMVRADGKNIWTALFWFRLSTAAYFGFGTCLIFIVNTQSRLRMETFYQFSDAEVIKLNLIVTLSVFLVLAAARMAIGAGVLTGMPHQPAALATDTDNERGLFVAGSVFLVVGVTVKYGALFPQQIGWLDTELPASFLSLARLTMVGIFLITLWSLQNKRWLLPFISCLVAIEMIFSFLMFAKGDVLMTLIFFLFAFLWKMTMKRLVFCGVLIFGVYFVLYPIVSNTRREMFLNYGPNAQVGFAERFEILRLSLAPDLTSGTSDGIQGALTRLSYVSAATLVIQLYDTDNASDWPELVPAVFIPRFLWPEKPIITKIGTDIYELGTGRDTSSKGAGVFADSYWAMGWFGVLVFMPIYGLIIGVLTRFTAGVLRDGRWIYFPVVLLALRIGFRTDGHYISDVAGRTVILVGTFVVIYALELVLKTAMKPAGRAE